MPGIAAPRRGLTLVELLVVIGIIVMLLAVAVPVMKLVTVDKKIREASRMMNAYIASIQSRAAERQRPVGIWIERSDIHSGMATTIYAAEVPPPYAGDFIGAKTTVTTISATQGRAEFDDGQSPSLPNLVKPGDFIRLDYKGPYYPITDVSPPSSPMIQIEFNYKEGTSLKSPVNESMPYSVPYQILRRPQRSMVGSIELPKTVVLDLTYSGIGNQGIEFAPDPSDPTNAITNETPIVILFSPTGRVDLVYAQNTTIRPQAPIHLLIGRDDQMDPEIIALDPDASLNVADPEAIWMSIGHLTGSVTTAPNQEPASGAFPANVAEARAEARRAHIRRGAS